MTGTTVTAKTVLVADDTAFVRDRFRTAVENAGHKAITVNVIHAQSTADGDATNLQRRT